MVLNNRKRRISWRYVVLHGDPGLVLPSILTWKKLYNYNNLQPSAVVRCRKLYESCRANWGRLHLRTKL